MKHLPPGWQPPNLWPWDLVGGLAFGLLYAAVRFVVLYYRHTHGA